MFSERLQNNLALQSGEQLPNANVDPGAKSDMASNVTLDVVVIGMLPLTRITIRCAEKEKDLSALFEGDTTQFR